MGIVCGGETMARTEVSRGMLTMGRRTRRRGVLFTVMFAVMSLGVTSLAPASTGPATFSDHVPAPGGFVTTSRPDISVRVYDPAGLRSDTVWVKVSGKSARVKFVYDRNPDGTFITTSGTIYATLGFDLAEGVYTIQASVMNPARKRSTDTWTITYANPPVLSAPSPGPGALVSTQYLTVGAAVGGGTSGLTYAVLVDGLPVAAVFDAGQITALLVDPLADDASHKVAVDVTNGAGLADTLAWTFIVQTHDAMPTVTRCVSCHAAYPDAHLYRDCDSCHAPDGPAGGGETGTIPADADPDDPDPLDHKSITDLPPCTDCHGGTSPRVPPLHAFEADGYHRTGSTLCAGAGCHVTSVTREHYRYSTAFTCLTCHTSTNSDVLAAISAGDVSCANCHADKVENGEVVQHGGDHGSGIAALSLEGEYEPGAAYGPIACDACHLVDLLIEHARSSSSVAAGSCDACHPSPRDTFGTWERGCIQGGCHLLGEHLDMVTKHAAPEGYECLSCHETTDVGRSHLAAELVVDGETRSSCLVCHMSTALPVSTACLDCHDGHGDLSVAHAASEIGTVGPVQGASASAPCTLCHHMDLRDEHAKPVSGSLGCEACHYTGGPVSQLGGSWDGSCAACHTTHHADYDAVHIIDTSSDCGLCHGSPFDNRWHSSCSNVAPGRFGAVYSCHVNPDTPAQVSWCRTCHPNE
jgi:hypothetical protein